MTRTVGTLWRLIISSDNQQRSTLIKTNSFKLHRRTAFLDFPGLRVSTWGPQHLHRRPPSLEQLYSSTHSTLSTTRDKGTRFTCMSARHQERLSTSSSTNTSSRSLRQDTSAHLQMLTLPLYMQDRHHSS